MALVYRRKPAEIKAAKKAEAAAKYSTLEAQNAYLAGNEYRADAIERRAVERKEQAALEATELFNRAAERTQRAQREWQEQQKAIAEEEQRRAQLIAMQQENYKKQHETEEERRKAIADRVQREALLREEIQRHNQEVNRKQEAAAQPAAPITLPSRPVTICEYCLQVDNAHMPYCMLYRD